MAVQLAPGSLFSSRYRVLKPLGHGGMSTVYEVRHEATGADRALKLMLPQLAAEPRFLRRFEQESRIGARIESDHIVEVIDAGIDQDTGLPFLLMERLHGEPLSAYVYRKGRLSRAELAAIFAQLGHALEAAHRVGIVHRDLKPENIFLARARRDGVPFTVKVLDFGIAKILAETHDTVTMMLGSPLWVAPEQTDTDRAVGPYTDVWALGLLAFFCLTGKPFWLRANEPGFSIPRLMRELLFDPIPAASERAAALTGAPLAIDGFDEWLARCVVREERSRFGSVAEARDALLALLTPPGLILDLRVEPPILWDSPGDAPFVSSPLVPYSPASRGEARRLSSRRPALLALAVAAPAALVALGVGLVLSRPQAATADASLAVHAPRSHEPAAARETIPARSAAPRIEPLSIPAPPLPPPPTPAAPPAAAPPSAARAPAPTPTFTLDLRDLPSTSAAPPAAPAPTGRRATAHAVATRSHAEDRATSAALAPGYLSLVCVPFCEAVVVRGRNLGPSPILREPLEPGAYTVQLRRRGTAPVSRTVIIQSGTPTSLRVRLDAQDGNAKGRGLPDL
jgi:serine/threonine-protein kinase